MAFTFNQPSTSDFKTIKKGIDFSHINVVEFEEEDFTDYNTAVGLDINPQDIVEYLNMLFGYSEEHEEQCPRYIAWRSFPEKEEDKKDDSKRPVVKFKEYKPGYEEDIINWTKWAADNNYSSYVIPCTTKIKGGKEEDILETGVIVIDIDNGDINKKLDHLQRHLGVPSMIVSSGGLTKDKVKKLHLYYKLKEFTDDLRNVVKARHEIACKVASDDSFQRITQPIRIAGSIHQKREPRLVTIEARNDLEYDLESLLVAIEEMPLLDGVSTFEHIDSKNKFTRPMDDVLIKGAQACAENVEQTRYTTLSRLIGHDIKLCHDGKISKDDLWNLVCSYNETKISPPWEPSQLSYNLERLWNAHCQKYGNPREFVPAIERGEEFKLYRYGEVYNDPTPRPEDLIGEFLLAKKGFLLISGPPKAMKSLLLQDLLTSVALGNEFLGKFKPSGKLKVLYIQAELSYWALRDRMRAKNHTPEEIETLDNNFITSDRFRWKLNEEGIDKLLRTTFNIYNETNKPDIICLDPMANIMDGDENDNNEVMEFLRSNLEELRQALNPDAGLILVHHSTKSSYKDIAESPFTSGIRGASCLQGYYSSCIVIARESPKHKERHIWFDFRDGPPPEEMVIEYVDGRFVEYKQDVVKVSIDKIKKAKTNVSNVKDIVLAGSYDGIYYSFNELKQALSEMGYTCVESIIVQMLKDGELLLFNGAQCALPELKGSSYRGHYIWVKGMVVHGTRVDEMGENGLVDARWEKVRPTHFVRPDVGTADVLPEYMVRNYMTEQ